MRHCREETICYQCDVLSHLLRTLCYINPLWCPTLFFECIWKKFRFWAQKRSYVISLIAKCTFLHILCCEIWQKIAFLAHCFAWNFFKNELKEPHCATDKNVLLLETLQLAVDDVPVDLDLEVQVQLMLDQLLILCPTCVTRIE